jgi:hypothetical protein
MNRNKQIKCLLMLAIATLTTWLLYQPTGIHQKWMQNHGDDYDDAYNDNDADIQSEMQLLPYHTPIPTESQQVRQETQSHAAFPRWADPHGIDLIALIQFVEHELAMTEYLVNTNQTFMYVPKTPYIISASGITTSRAIHQRHTADMRQSRVVPTEFLYMYALHHWTLTPSQWPNITRVLSHHGSFPIVVWQDDFRGCNHHNHKLDGDELQSSVPFFTTCARVDCDYAWPQPTYQLLHDAHTGAYWGQHFRMQAHHYPWERKRTQVLWRGSLTGRRNLDQNVRWAAARLAHTTMSPYWNIGLTAIPPPHNAVALNVTTVGGLVHTIPRRAFSEYRAVLDMDGNSWSSRFGRLLCDNSVVLKVEPEYVDLFHFQQDKNGQYELQAGKHYIPVHYNLSNLMEQTEYVMDPRNDAAVRVMVQNAQDWCRSHLTPVRMLEDVLDLWEAYVGHLDRWNPDWSNVWQKEQGRWLVPAFDSVALPMIRS